MLEYKSSGLGSFTEYDINNIIKELTLFLNLGYDSISDVKMIDILNNSKYTFNR